MRKDNTTTAADHAATSSPLSSPAESSEWTPASWTLGALLKPVLGPKVAHSLVSLIEPVTSRLPSWCNLRTFVLGWVAKWAVFLVVFLLVHLTRPKEQVIRPPLKDDGSMVHMCSHVSKVVAARYTDLLGYPLRKTPDLAIDAMVLRETDENGGGIAGLEMLFCNRSRPPPMLAIPGGFVEVGEAAIEAFARELLEETTIDLVQWMKQCDAVGLYDQKFHPFSKLRHAPSAVDPVPLGSPFDTTRQQFARIGNGKDLEARLFALYGNPMRDSRRQTVSSTYVVFIPKGSRFAGYRPKGRDDVKHCAFWNMQRLVDLERQREREEGEGSASRIFGFDHSMMVQDVFAFAAAVGIYPR